MSIKGIEVCKNGVIVAVHNGWFLCDEQDLDLVKEFRWRIGNGKYVTSSVWCYDHSDSHIFHKELAHKKLGCYPECIDHRNSVRFDNRDYNLFSATSQLNNFRRASRGYGFSSNSAYGCFQSSCGGGVRGFTKQMHSYHKTEDSALLKRREYELCIPTFWRYNPAEDMRDCLDLLLQEVRGQLTKQDVYYLRLKELSQNSWYILRYNLENECIKYNIPITPYILDKIGFMCNKEGIRLCPYITDVNDKQGVF